MGKFRKILVFLVAFAVVSGAYLLYSHIADTPVISPGDDDTGGDIEVPDFGQRTGEIGDADIGKVEQSRFVFLDPETKELRQVLGFERLLGREPGEIRRKVVNPYMEIYEKNFFCRITSDYGLVRVETAAGAQSPKDARLYGNVKIHIQSGDPEKPDESVIYLEDVAYNSERSEFVTDKPIRLVSADVEMEGTGMVLIYNTRLGRLEYFKVVDLDELRFVNVKTLMPAESEVDESQEMSEPSQEEPAGQTEIAEGEPTTEEGDYYECRFSRDVVIDYGGEILVTSADDLTISNINWAGSSSSKGETGEGATSESGEAVEKDPGETKSAEAVSAAEAEEIITVRVKCSGGMIVQPKTSVMEPLSSGEGEDERRAEFDDVPVLVQRTTLDELIFKNSNYACGASAEDEADELKEVAVLEDVREPVTFKAKKIDYDMNTGNAIAAGPMEFVFYAEVDITEPNSNDISPKVKVFPVVITAQKDAQFLVGESGRVDRVVFNENVVGTRKSGTVVYEQEDKFTGERLVVELAGGDETDAMEIRHVVIEGGDVKLESLRSREAETISHVRLICKRIDYYLQGSAIIATGPGKMELDNSKAEPSAKESKSRFDMAGPCYAYAEGFKTLRWFMEENTIIADGGDVAVSLSYAPVVEGKLGAVVKASAGYVEAELVDAGAGRSQLERLRARGGVYYDEENGHWFEGENLVYDRPESLMTITGSDAHPCQVDGAQVSEIEYNLETGKVKTRLSSRPGSITPPQREGN